LSECLFHGLMIELTIESLMIFAGRFCRKKSRL
jgi:hypothetical protein